MRRLLLLRHAKAERSVPPGKHDHDRVLAERGREQAPLMGAYMARHGLVPERAIVSNAARTRETWKLVAASFPKTPKVTFEERIYEATPQAILQAVKECGRDVHTLLVVGHNPGLQELAAMLIASGSVEARQRLNEKYPTAGLAVIDFALDDWAKLHPDAGRLDHFVSPRSLAATTD
jgi:phosphohistidine phosphatase